MLADFRFAPADTPSSIRDETTRWARKQVSAAGGHDSAFRAMRGSSRVAADARRRTRAGPAADDATKLGFGFGIGDQHGRARQAEILSIETEGNSGTLNPIKAYTSTDDDFTTRWWLCKLELRIMPLGEAAFETTVHTRLNTIKAKGDIVPVLYDPDNHDDVVVDYTADAKAEMDRRDALRRATKR